MSNYPPALFNKSPMQLRLLGARGGRAFGRNQRARRALISPPKAVSVPLLAALRPTTAEAIALLDTQFPWLRGAEKRHSKPLAAVTGKPMPALPLHRAISCDSRTFSHVRPFCF
jgi:hypothetical protein